MNIYEKLQSIQCELKAPKNLKNTFGNYNYRNAEGILEALKPLLEKNKCTVVINDGLTEKAGRLFIESSVRIFNCEDTDEGLAEHISAKAYAELDEHKGMCADQATGCASSYARKYALNALFLLDDTKDTDTDEHHEEVQAKTVKPISIAQLNKIKREMERTGVTEQKICETFKAPALNALTSEQASQLITKLSKTEDKK